MNKQFSIVRAIVMLTIAFASTGCSNVANPVFASRQRAASSHTMAQAAGTWSELAPMPTARYGLGAGVVNGILYAVGGFDENSVTGTVEAYDPSTHSWVTKAPMPTARWDLGVGVVSGILYAVGGYNNGYLHKLEAYDPST